MSSELQRQVSSLRKQHLTVAPLHQGRPSLFLTAAEAAGVDVSTIQEAAHSGLATLQQYDSRFEPFMETLLHPSSVDSQRELMTVAENKALDVQIVRLLRLLGLYALEASTHLVLEYLIRRYRVHEMNTHDLLQCMMVVHDTKIFGRIVQLCKLEDSVWGFLQGVKNSGVPLPRSALVQRALKDAQLLEVLTQYVHSSLELVVQRPSALSATPPSMHSIAGANRILSFYAAVTLEMAEERSFDDTRMRHVYLFLLEGLKNKYVQSINGVDVSGDINILDQWRRACCMLLIQLSMRTPFSKALVKVFSGAVSESYRRASSADTRPTPELLELVSTMSILAQQQKFRIGSKVLSHVIGKGEKFDIFLTIIGMIKETYNTVPLVASLAASLSSELCQQGQVVEVEGESSVGPATLSRSLCLLLSSELADSSIVRSVLSTLLCTIKKQKSQSPLPVHVAAGIKACVQCIAQRYASDFESTVEIHLRSDGTAAAEGGALSAYLADVFSASDLKHHKRTAEQGGGLLLSLSSAIPAVRAQAMAEFSTNVSLTAASSPDFIGLAQAAAQNLLDPISDVALASWNLPVLQRVAAHLPSSELLELYATSFSFWSDCLAKSPAIAMELVQAIFTTMEDASVLKSVLTDKAGVQWVFQTALPIALGALSVHASGDVTKLNALASSAALVLKASASMHSSLSGFSVLCIKRDASQDAVTQAVLSATTSEKFLRQQEGMDLLVSTAIRFNQTESTSPEIAVAYLNCLVTSAETLSGGRAEAQRKLLLDNATPLFLGTLRNSERIAASSIDLLLAILERIVTLLGKLVPSAAEGETVAAKVIALSAPLPFHSLGYRVLIAVLSSGTNSVSRKLAVCLHSLQPEAPWSALLRVVLSVADPSSRCLAAHASATPDTASSAMILVPASARSAALHAIGACVSGISATLSSAGKTSNKTLSAADSQFTLLLSAVTLKLCTENSSEMRQLGLTLAERVSVLSTHISLPKQAGSISSEDAGVAVRELCSLLTARASIIAVEPHAASAALTSEVFDAGKTSAGSALCWLASEFGWSNSVFSTPIIAAAGAIQFKDTWQHMRHIIESAAGEAEDAGALAQAVATAVKLGFASAPAKVQSEVTASIIAVVSSVPKSRAAGLMKQQVILLIQGGLFASASAEARASLYDALMQEQLSRPGQHDVLAALVAVQVDLSAPAQLLAGLLDAFASQYKKVSASNSAAMTVEGDFDDNSGELSGLSVPLQHILSVLEAVADAFASANPETEGGVLGSLAARLFDFLDHVNDARLRTVMLVDYCKALAMDTIHVALSVGGASIVSTERAGKKSTSSSTSSAKKDSISSGYSLGRVDSDVRLLLNCITSTKATSVQSSALKLLKVLLAMNPATVMPSMKTLGELLAASSTHMQAGREGLIEQILRTFVSFLPEAGASSGSDAALMPQCMLQSLCQHFHAMPHHRRSALLKMALSAMKAPATLAVAVNVLLVHSFAAHETEAAVVNNPNTITAATEESSAQEVMILLSKSAHRRAHREMKSSVPEELFTLATELMMMRTPNTQVSVIIALLGSAHRLLDVAFGSTEKQNPEGHDTLDIDQTVSYCTALLLAQEKNSTVKSHRDNQRGHAATIAVLHLELIIDILENKNFHQLLVSVMDAQSGAVVQEYFMSFADSVLQLLAMSSTVEQGLGAGRQKELLCLRVDGSQVRLAPKALGKHVSKWCYEALRTLQKLMDGPSFVSIIQELIDHEQMEVRQKALVILGERLEGMSTNKLKNDSEIDLYLDLNAHLRQVVKSFIPKLKESTMGAIPAEFHQHSGLAQSALMCMDVLARFLGKRLDWSEVLSYTLKDVVAISAALTAASIESDPSKGESTAKAGKKAKKTASVVQQDSPVLQSEYCKLLGSASLCSATMCSVLGAKSLTFLPDIMSQCLTSLEITGAQVVAGPAVVLADDSSADEASALWRTRVLLVRSTVAAVGIIVAQLSNFSHPYIPRILTATLPLEGLDESFSERNLIREDVDRCLSTIASKIPARLSIPLLLQCAPTILASGHCAAARFADLMAEVWQQLDRAAVVAQLTPLSNLATLLLDYRRVFGDQSAAAAEVDAAASDAVVELCLKLTESELKSFLTKLAEWRDVKFKAKKTASGEIDVQQEWRRYARAVSYFSLADALMGKLKSLFIPIMGVLWGSAIELLNAFAAQAAKAPKHSELDNSVEQKDKSGKRKAEQSESRGGGDNSAQAESGLLVELELLSRYVLSSVRECCAQDENGFVDEHRFEKMMQAVVSLLPLQRAFPSEVAYLVYAEDFVGACLSALAVAVGKDLQWKPLNHKVLLLTRDNKKAVRVAAVKVLHRLFSEVGDQYLLLLPECLPFLSELMEDSNRDVVAATSEAVKFIEELSGEKLDEYLQ